MDYEERIKALEEENDKLKQELQETKEHPTIDFTFLIFYFGIFCPILNVRRCKNDFTLKLLVYPPLVDYMCGGQPSYPWNKSVLRLPHQHLS